MSTTPAQVITDFAAALHDGRLDDAVALYEPDAAFVPQPGAEPLHGLDQIRAALAGFAALRPTLTPDIRKVVQAGDIATVLNSWTLDGTRAGRQRAAAERHQRRRHAPPAGRHLGPAHRRPLGSVTTAHRRVRSWSSCPVIQSSWRGCVRGTRPCSPP